MKRPEMRLAAGKEYHRKTTGPHQMWATDASYFRVVGWGYYYLVTVMDDYSRFILAHRLQRDMTSDSFIEVVQEAVGQNGPKLSYRWSPAVAKRWAASGGRLIRDEETGEPFKVPCCPVCSAQIVDKDGVPLTDEDLSCRKRVCAHCGSALWQADNSGPRRYRRLCYDIW